MCEYGEDDAVFVKNPSVLGEAGLTDEAVSAVKQGMKQMVESSSYVSRLMKDIPVTVGGKTGTAELGGSTQENGLFVCAAPYDSPRIVVSSVVEHAGGGSYASIAAAAVLEEYFSE